MNCVEYVELYSTTTEERPASPGRSHQHLSLLTCADGSIEGDLIRLDLVCLPLGPKE